MRRARLPRLAKQGGKVLVIATGICLFCLSSHAATSRMACFLQKISLSSLPEPTNKNNSQRMKRQEIVNRIRETMHRIAPEAQTILYGSEARGEARPDSDIDLLVVLDENQLTPERELEIARPLYELEVESGIIISPIIVLRKVWESITTPFSINVMKEGIVL